MAWNSVSVSATQIAQAAHINNLQGNFSALANHDSGAPSILSKSMNDHFFHQVSTGTFTATKNITVDGDTDLVYKLIIRAVGSGMALALRFNNDSSSVYNYSNIIYGTAATSVDDNSGSLTTLIPIHEATGVFTTSIECTIHAAKLGTLFRMVHTSAYDYNNTASFLSVKGGGMWNNSANNITQINIVLAAGTITSAEYYLLALGF